MRIEENDMSTEIYNGSLSSRFYRNMNDSELLSYCRRKDKKAFEELIRRHNNLIMSMLYRFAPDWADRSDLAQDAFIKMWRGIEKLENPNAFKSWAYQIVTNLFYDELRKRARHSCPISLDQSFDGDAGDEPWTFEVKDPSAGPDELLHRKEVNKAVQDAIVSLPRQFKNAIVLRELAGLSYDDIALLTGADMGTVKSRISRARNKVEVLVKDSLETEPLAKIA
jgi:RNA polymerase sigma-70 factor (ECF subfamily)